MLLHLYKTTQGSLPEKYSNWVSLIALHFCLERYQEQSQLCWRFLPSGKSWLTTITRHFELRRDPRIRNLHGISESLLLNKSLLTSPTPTSFLFWHFKNKKKMINLFKAKQKQKEAAESGQSFKKQSLGELRVQKGGANVFCHLKYRFLFQAWNSDISELNFPKTTSISFPQGKDNLMNFEITIRPDEGYYTCVESRASI